MKNLAILLVDDDPVIRRLLEQRLTDENFRVDVAENGYVAQTKLAQNFYDVVITDLMMPGDMGGIEVLEIAKEFNSMTEVLLITAHSSVDTAVAAMKKGASDYLEKPINFDELFLRLDKVASMQSIIKNAQDLQVAMDTTEDAASFTIQTLEMRSVKLQEALDEVETLLRDDELRDDIKIGKALSIIGET